MNKIALSQRTVRPRSLDQSMVSLINVVFLLLIFFLVAGDLSKTLADGLIPPRSGNTNIPALHETWLSLDTSGQLKYKDQKYTLAKFVKFGEQSNLILPAVFQLRVDQSVESHHLLSLLDELKAFGVEKVVLLTLSNSGM